MTGTTVGMSDGVGDGDDGGHLKPYKLSLTTNMTCSLVLLIQLVCTKYKLTINRKKLVLSKNKVVQLVILIILLKID